MTIQEAYAGVRQGQYWQTDRMVAGGSYIGLYTDRLDQTSIAVYMRTGEYLCPYLPSESDVFARTWSEYKSPPPAALTVGETLVFIHLRDLYWLRDQLDGHPTKSELQKNLTAIIERMKANCEA